MIQILHDIYNDLNQFQLEAHTITITNAKTLLTIQKTWPQLTDSEHDTKMLETNYQQKLHCILASLMETKHSIRKHIETMQKLRESMN